MRFSTLILALLFCFSSSVFAKKIISDLDFNRGDWAMVGVPLHNYKQLPIQKELSTFVSKDMDMMREIQRTWDFEQTFEDKCDFHYSLKFYRNGELVRTLNLNLYCGYITYDGMSYEFNPVEFERFRNNSSSIAWSRISFADLELLRKAIYTLDKADDVYWYDDVKQYTYPGFIVVSIDGLSWNTDMDSLFYVVEKKVVERAGTNQFYLQKYFHVIRGDDMYAKYLINCTPEVAARLEQYADYPWRSHLHNRDSVSILAIGIDRNRYWKLMNE
ncbi:MAG: hypothetical protein R3D00_19580 [Bacteroidia bacterium]